VLLDSHGTASPIALQIHPESLTWILNLSDLRRQDSFILSA
jgi:hypothetical protein